MVIRNAVIVLSLLLACWPCALALDPALDVNQYSHTAWKINEGFSKGVIRALAQTPDGYLWLGTEFGLLRFDGVRAVPWEPAGEHLPSSDIRSLLGARDGSVWVGTFRGLASWKDGKLTRYPELDGQVIEALLEDREGTVWVGGWAPSLGRLCAIRGGHVDCHGEEGRFGSGVSTLYEDKEGNLWVGGMNGLWRWKPGVPKLYPIPDPVHRIYSLTESDDGGILVAKTSGIRKLKNGKVELFPLPAGPEFQPYRVLRDHDGLLWIGAVVDKALLHIHEGRTDLFSRADGLSGDAVTALLEDREGNIWVATVDGLDRFRDFAVPTISAQQGLSSRGVSSILAATDGSLWLGLSDGLNRWKKGQITIYRKRRLPRGHGASQVSGYIPATSSTTEITDNGLPDAMAEALFEDHHGQIWVGTQSGVAVFRSDRFFPINSLPGGVVFSIVGDNAGNVWVGHQEGLFHLLQQRVVERISWAKLGRREPATALFHDAVNGGLWLGFRDGRVAYLKDGQVRASYGVTEGLGEGMIRGFYLDVNGTLWVETEGGLSRIKDGRVLTLTSQNGLPCNTVHWMMEDDAHSVWLYMACGLVRIDPFELQAWASSNPKRTIHPTVFESSDGVSNHRFTGGYNAIVAKSADGRLWFLALGGVSVLDPHRLPFNKLPPPMHIEQITADDKTYAAANGMRLPPRVHNLGIDYTALSLVVPEKVRFRIKLEGQDKDWRELVNVRHVEYTNLPPEHYRFRVIACNNSGVWNEEGATLDFIIPPAWYQTNWFRAACIAIFLAMIWGIHKLRMRRLAAEFNMRLEERIGERTRIARDLHDTLLQSFQGLVFRFQAARYQLPNRPEEASEALDSALDSADQAIAEGRSAIQQLRSGLSEESNLEQMLLATGRELASSQNGEHASPPLRVIVEGSRRAKRAMIREEVYRIARELLRNAYRHAHAQNIEAELRYDDDAFLLIVRDDGRGIDSKVLKDRGRAGHWGLPGIYERAEGMGARLDIWSEVGAGTEVRLRVPAAIAYEKSADRGRFKLFRKTRTYEHRS